MRFLGRLAASLGCAAVAAVGVAAPAGAAEFSGTYEFDMAGDKATWTIVECGHEHPAPCAYVVQNGGDMAPWSAEAYLNVGWWTLKVQRPDTIVCDDGEKHPALTTYSWDAVTLEGWIGAHDDGVCDDEAGSLAAPFTLTKTGPAEVAAPAPAPAPEDVAPPPILPPAEAPPLGAEAPASPEAPAEPTGASLPAEA